MTEVTKEQLERAKEKAHEAVENTAKWYKRAEAFYQFDSMEHDINGALCQIYSFHNIGKGMTAEQVKRLNDRLREIGRRAGLQKDESW